MLAPSVTPITTLLLKHNGDCNLLGVAPDMTVYVEEVYGDEGWLAQHALRLDGSTVSSVDENNGAAGDLAPLTLPDAITKPKTGWHTMALNFAGPRHRGMRSPERTDELVHPLSIQEKMTLVKQLKLDVAPPMLLGIAESYVLAECQIASPSLYFVCRRVRLALALGEERLDDDNQPYDYDTVVVHLAHFYECGSDLTLGEILDGLTGAPLHRPMDCLLYGDHLFIADGGAGDRPSAIHVWRVEQEEAVSQEDRLHKKLYG